MKRKQSDKGEDEFEKYFTEFENGFSSRIGYTDTRHILAVECYEPKFVNVNWEEKRKILIEFESEVKKNLPNKQAGEYKGIKWRFVEKPEKVRKGVAVQIEKPNKVMSKFMKRKIQDAKEQIESSRPWSRAYIVLDLGKYYTPDECMNLRGLEKESRLPIGVKIIIKRGFFGGWDKNWPRKNSEDDFLGLSGILP